MKKSDVVSVIFELMLLAHCLLVTASCPSACFCDDPRTYVSCVGDGLWEVPQDLPTTVTRLELRNYIVDTLSASSIGYLANLTELKLQQTQIQNIENSTFENLEHLERLDLSQNGLENITVATFAGLTTLRYLDLSTNQLVHICGAFSELINVEQLNLRENKVPHLRSGSLTGLMRVQYLNLDSNQISSIDVGTFQYLTNLVHLILSNNPLTQLTRLDFFSSRLLYIDVSHVGLRRVPQSLTQVVRDLRLAKNNLTQIHLGDFDSYPHLGLLVLDDNLITDIENDALGRQESLLRLWLNGNQLRRVPTNLPPTLRTLYIEENQLEVLGSYSFQGLTNVEQLFLQRNRLREMAPCAFCDLVSLRGLDLQANLLEHLNDGVFANLSKLESLDLSQNPLKSLSGGCFAGIESLTALKLSRLKGDIQFDETVFDPLKNLETLEIYDSAAFAHQVVNSTRALHGLRNLRELNVMHNNLMSVRSDLPNFFPQLKVMKMSGNNWYCDRSILWLTSWIKRSEIQFYRSYSIRCSTPENLQYKPIMMLAENDFPTPTPPSTTTTTPIPTTTTTAKTTTSTTIITTTTHASTTTAIATHAKILPVINDNKTTSNVTTPPSSHYSATPTPRPHLSNATQSSKTARVEMTQLPTTTPLPHNGSQFTSPLSALTSTPLTTARTTAPPILVAQSSVPEGTTSLTTTEPSTSPLPLHPATTPTTQASTTVHSSTVSPTTLGIKLITGEVFIPMINRSTPRSNISTKHVTTKPHVEEITPSIKVLRAEVKHREHQTVLVAAASVAAGVGLLLAGAGLVLGLYRCRKTPPGSSAGLHCPVGVRRSSSSIAYHPQRDEVSIVTVSEGTVGLKTATHNGLGNKLYFVMENGDGPCDPIRDALGETDYHELLPDSLKDGGVGGYTYVT